MDRPHLFIHSFIDGHWDCFYPLGIANRAAMNMYFMCLLEYLFSVLLYIYLGMELLGYMVTLFHQSLLSSAAFANRYPSSMSEG